MLGLDTAVDVFLNGKHVLASKNMHVQHQVDVTEVVKNAEGTGLLELQFRNAPAFAREEMRRIGYTENRTDVKFGVAERLFLRKAQFHWVCGSAIPAMVMTWVGK
jgi:beta-mannosidase